MKESQNQVDLLHKNLEETRNRLEQLQKKEQEYEEYKQATNSEFSQVESQLATVRQENEQLREDVQWYNNERKWQVAIGMIPLALFGMREFLIPRFHDVAKETCSRFKRGLTYEYCVRNWVGEESLLIALSVIEQLPVHTRIFRFDEPQRFSPGYNLAFQARDGKKRLTNYLKILEEMYLYIPTDFMALENLFISELHLSLSAFFNQLSNQDSLSFVKQFAATNLLLCGIMPDHDRQNKCATELAGSMRAFGQWPCKMDNRDVSKINVCENFMLPGFTQKLTEKYVLGLLPVWSVKDSGQLKWYDPWPALINKHAIKNLTDKKNCHQSIMDISKYCDSGTLRVWRFIDNHWDLKSHYCREFATVDTRIPLAFWLQSWDGNINDIFSCNEHEQFETAW